MFTGFVCSSIILGIALVMAVLMICWDNWFHTSIESESKYVYAWVKLVLPFWTVVLPGISTCFFGGLYFSISFF